MPGAASFLRFLPVAPFLLLLVGCGSRTGLIPSENEPSDGSVKRMPESGARDAPVSDAHDAGEAGDAPPDAAEAGPILALRALLLRMDSTGPVGYPATDVNAAGATTNAPKSVQAMGTQTKSLLK